MKEKYINPIIEEISLELDDIICVSLEGNGDGDGGTYEGIFGN